MKGYLINTADKWNHICKRAVQPGGKIPLDELFDSYGKKHKIPKKDFVSWIIVSKIKDNKDWKIEI